MLNEGPYPSKHIGLKGRVAIVTGASGGIGGACVVALGLAGAKIVLVDHEKDKGLALHEQVNKVSRSTAFCLADVTKVDQCERVVRETVERFGSVDVLINGAGVIHRKTVLETDENDWDRTLSVNLKSVFLMCKFAIPEMERCGGGAIVNISSGWGLVGGAKAAAYCASKGGVVLLTRALALDHGGANIRVNCVCPGDTDTAMLASEAQQLGISHAAMLAAGKTRPLGRIGRPEEIASVATFLASSQASFITGATLAVDGGSLAGSP